MLESMGRKQRYPQQELADRLVAAMEEANLSQAELSRQCGVTIQSVHDWRETGRIGKQHLITIARLTRKPLEYFLVGLGRAAVILIAVLLLVLSPRPAEAAFNISLSHITHCMTRLMRRLQELLTVLLHAKQHYGIGR